MNEVTKSESAAVIYDPKKISPSILKNLPPCYQSVIEGKLPEVTQPSGELPFINVIILGQSVKALLDIGAQISLIGSEFLRELLKPQCKLQVLGLHHVTIDSTTTVVENKFNIFSSVALPVTYKGSTQRVEFRVAKGKIAGNFILGTNALHKFGLALKNVNNKLECNFSLEKTK